MGVFFDAALLEFVEFLPRLAVEVFAVHHKYAFVDVLVFLEQRSGLEGGERLAAAGGVPDVAVALVFVYALHDVLHGIDLVGPHDHDFLLPRQQHHVAADGAAEVALFQEALGKFIELGDLAVAFVCELVDGQKALVGIEGKVVGVVVGEVPGAVAVADDKQLHKAEQCLGVAVAGVVLVLDNLLHGPARVHAQGFELDLHTGHTVDEQDDVVAVVAVVGVDAQLVDDLVVVFAPVLEVHQRVVQRRAVVAGKGIDAAQGLGRGVNVGGDDFIQQPGELGIGEADPVEGLELLAEVLLQSGAVADVGAEFVLQVLQLAYEAVLDLLFFDDGARCLGQQIVGGLG